MHESDTLGRIRSHGAYLAVLIAGSALLGGCNRNISDSKIDFIDLRRAVELHEAQLDEPGTALFIDTRKPERFAEGHIKGARNIRVNEINPDFDPDPEIIRYDNLVVYGENPASATARVLAKRLISAGYNTILRRRVRLFQGGWVVWESSGLPIEREPIDENESAENDGDEKDGVGGGDADAGGTP